MERKLAVILFIAFMVWLNVMHRDKMMQIRAFKLAEQNAYAAEINSITPEMQKIINTAKNISDVAEKEAAVEKLLGGCYYGGWDIPLSCLQLVSRVAKDSSLVDALTKLKKAGVKINTYIPEKPDREISQDPVTGNLTIPVTATNPQIKKFLGLKK